MPGILAVSSGGGHWEELMLLRDVLDGPDVHFATTVADLPERAGLANASILPDCNRDKPMSSLHCLMAAFRLVRRLRPDTIISTGAAPGFFCILAGRIFGARTLWVESFANAEQLSLCGKLSVKLADRCMVQWEHLARPGGPVFEGSLL